MSVRRAALAVASAAAVVVAATACAMSRDDHAGDGAAARALVGAWDVRFARTDAGPGEARRSRQPAVVRGLVAFVPGRRVDGADELPDPTDVGTFAVDFGPFGFDPHDPARPPIALARASGPDSVALLLGTGEKAPAVSMHGAWSHDSIVGEWSLVSTRVLGASGTFTMTRHGGGTRPSAVDR